MGQEIEAFFGELYSVKMKKAVLQGRADGESIRETAVRLNVTDTVLYSRSTSYDESNSKITATDEFGKATVYMLDPIWGTVQSISLPDGSVVSDEYDTDHCILQKRIFGNADGRSNTLTYAGGNLSSLQTGSLGYTFGYTEGKLTAVSKNSVSVEEHTHTPTRTDSYYPSQSGVLHSTTALFDKYGRLASIPGVLTNTYDLLPDGNTLVGVDNGSSLLATTTDEMCSETAKFAYNEKNQLSSKTVVQVANQASEISQETFVYDDFNRMTGDTFVYNKTTGKQVSAQIEYLPTASNPANDSRVSKYTFDPPGVSNAVTENTFDDFKRLVSKKYTLGGNVINRSYTYNNSRVTKCVDKSTVYYIGTNDYTYDAMGRIKTDNHSGKYAPSNYRSYEYDEYGQLQRENNQGLAKTFMYEYNGIGNLTAIKEYALSLSTTPAGTPVTTTFGYTDDRLTSFGGTTISYNAMGCPTSYDGKIATWAEGKLSRLSQGSKITGMSTYNYGYNGYGQRISRSYSYAAGTSGTGAAQLGQLTACSRKYYYDHAGRLIAEDVTKTYYGEGTTTENIVFLYDESGIIGMELTIGGTTNLYYFQRNLQGDVVSIYDPSGTLKAHYLYDAWGNCTIASETTSYDVANANPIRYRGYYYDDDTGLYYCNARYYSPKWRRFISPDDTSYLDPESVNGLNLYCYCNNNPIMFIDALGNSCVPVCTLIWALGAVVVGYQLFRLNLYRENYASNSAIDGDPSTSTHNQLIHAQNDAIIRSFMYGKRHAWWNACETIAIHNAKVLLGIDSTLSQTMLDCQNSGIMIGDGQFGSNPFFIGIVLRKHDISYSLVSREGMTKPGVYIISYWNKAWYKSGLHTIAVHYDGSQYIAYNVGSNEKNGIPIDPSDYRWRFIIGYYLGG